MGLFFFPLPHSKYTLSMLIPYPSTTFPTASAAPIQVSKSRLEPSRQTTSSGEPLKHGLHLVIFLLRHLLRPRRLRLRLPLLRQD